VSSDNFVVVDTTGEPRVIGETDFTSGPSTLHPKAIYIVEARLFQVDALDFEGRKAFVRHTDCDYYTDAITYTRVSVLDRFDGNDQATASHGEVHVVSRVVGFKKIRFYTNENVGSGDLDLPEQQMHTTAYWLTIPPAVMDALPFAADDRRDAVVGLSFALRQVAQLLLMCDGHDIGISIEAPEPEEFGRGGREARIFVYDNYPGGVGFSAPLFRMHHALISATKDLIAGCPCEKGCPSCVGPIADAGLPTKLAVLRILSMLETAFPADPCHEEMVVR
jgi:DEAD/DEAH box helicase domain-containing protein